MSFSTKAQLMSDDRNLLKFLPSPNYLNLDFYPTSISSFKVYFSNMHNIFTSIVRYCVQLYKDFYLAVFEHVPSRHIIYIHVYSLKYSVHGVNLHNWWNSAPSVFIFFFFFKSWTTRRYMDIAISDLNRVQTEKKFSVKRIFIYEFDLNLSGMSQEIYTVLQRRQDACILAAFNLT